MCQEGGILYVYSSSLFLNLMLIVTESFTAGYFEDTEPPIFEPQIVDLVWYIIDKEVGQTADIVKEGYVSLSKYS